MRRQFLVALAVGAALAAILSYPTIARPGSVARVDTDDGKFSVWNVAWVAHALVDGRDRVFDANIFYPRTGTLAYSEANLVAGALAAPVYALTGNPLTAFNAVVFTILVLAFVSMWALVRRLSGSWTGALVAATAFAFAPYVAARTAHIQLLMVWVFPVVFLAFHRLVDAPGVARGAVLGLTLALAALSCGYYGVFAGLAVGLAAVWFAFGQPHQRRYWAGLAAAVVVSGLLVAPVLRPYLALRAEAGARRVVNLDEAREYSANVRAYLSSPSRLHEWVSERYLTSLGPAREGLFPGVLLTLFAVLGVWSAARPGTTRKWKSPEGAERIVAFYVVLTALAVWASFGPGAGLYGWLAQTMPFMSFLRAPARFGAVVIFALAVLAGFGLARVVSRRGTWLAAALTAAVAIEVAAVPWDLHEPDPLPEAYRRLAELPRGGVVEFHFPYRSNDLFRHTRYMFDSIWHWQPLINGYSDYIPQEFRDMAVPINGFPDDTSFKILREHQARYVVIHLDTYGDAEKRAILLARFPPYMDYLKPIVQTGDTWLFEIQKWP
ncbi:MAG TPA: hypothetical protein VES67_14320 [Vicinamibacterales bacterium]|nr:hypothetical protein [Vicinamibacterales bacterium]